MGVSNAIHKNPSSAMFNFQETLDDIENRFLTNPEDMSLLVGMLIELDNFIENTNDEINRGLLTALKKCFKTKT